MMAIKKKGKGREKQPNAFYRYTGIAIQMAVVIMLGVFGGQKLDEHYSMEKPLFTIIFSIIGVGTALYLTIRDLNR